MIFLVLVTLSFPRLATLLGGSPPAPASAGLVSIEPVLVSYSYFEKDAIQVGPAAPQHTAAAAQPLPN